MDKRNIQIGFEIGFNKQRDYRYNLGPSDECLEMANRILKKYDPSLRLRLVRKRDRIKKNKRLIE